MSKKFDYLVYIGRFQPFHYAHLQTVQIALQHSLQVVLALGSTQAERNIKNPFSAAEREQMILSNFPVEMRQRIKFVHVIDVYDDVKWVKLVKDQVNAVIAAGSNVGLIGHFKDDSSYYLQLFPEWTLFPLDSLKDAISATPIREAYFKGTIIEAVLPLGSIQFLRAFQQTGYYKQLQAKCLAGDTSNIEFN